MTARTQKETLMDHFSRRKTLTKDEAVTKYGIMSLSRRIVDLEEMGMTFDRQRMQDADGNRFTRYRVTSAPSTVR
jgi:hypothetical protein